MSPQRLIWTTLLFSQVIFAAPGPLARPAPPNLETYLALPMPERVKALQNHKPESLQYLSRTAFAKDKSLLLRWRALTTMGRMDADYFAKDLERAAQSGEWFMRNAALIALQTGDHDRAVKFSLKALTDPALVVRTQAVRNLIELNARESEGRLWTEIFSRTNFRGEESLWVRVHMAEALAQFASPQRVKSFHRLLLDPDERLHKWAILGLETATGFKLGDAQRPLDIRRQQWLERLGGNTL